MGFVESLTDLGANIYNSGVRKNDVVWVTHDSSTYSVESDQARAIGVEKLEEIFMNNLLFIYPITYHGE